MRLAARAARLRAPVSSTLGHACSPVGCLRIRRTRRLQQPSCAPCPLLRWRSVQDRLQPFAADLLAMPKAFSCSVSSTKALRAAVLRRAVSSTVAPLARRWGHAVVCWPVSAPSKVGLCNAAVLATLLACRVHLQGQCSGRSQLQRPWPFSGCAMRALTLRSTGRATACRPGRATPLSILRRTARAARLRAPVSSTLDLTNHICFLLSA